MAPSKIRRGVITGEVKNSRMLRYGGRIRMHGDTEAVEFPELLIDSFSKT